VAIGKGLGPAHAIAITVGDQGLHHGMLSGLGVAATITLLHEQVPERVNDLARAMGLNSGEQIAVALQRLFGRLGLPARLRQLGYRPGELQELANAAATSHFNLSSRYRPSAEEYGRMLGRLFE
jgi:alcohol dehydrogenase class IV